MKQKPTFAHSCMIQTWCHNNHCFCHNCFELCYLVYIYIYYTYIYICYIYTVYIIHIYIITAAETLSISIVWYIGWPKTCSQIPSLRIVKKLNGSPYVQLIESHGFSPFWTVPSGKLLHNYRKSPFLTEKLTIDGHFQYSYVSHYQRVEMMLFSMAFPNFRMARLFRGLWRIQGWMILWGNWMAPGWPSGYDSQFAMERSTMLLIGKPSISMGHLYHGYVQ